MALGYWRVGEVPDYRRRLAMLLSILFLSKKRLKGNLAKFYYHRHNRFRGCGAMVLRNLPLQWHDKIRDNPVRYD